MSQLVDRNPIQLLDEDGHFKDGLPSALSRWGFNSTGTSYHVLAIMGSQSSGKSTLLNRLFATQFEEMQDRMQKTTRGIWVSPAAKNSILIMDVEGVDGRERGGDTKMEKKTTLFSLAIAEVVLINIWANQTNNYSGSNMELIGMVVQRVFELFQTRTRHTPKTLLFFVARDATSKQRTEAGMAELLRVLRVQLDNIWANITKGQAACFEDFFDVRLEGLPQFDSSIPSREFDAQTRRLSEEFYDENRETAIFKREYHRGTLIDGLPKYLQDVWSEVDRNEFANLPSIQRLNQEFLCDKYKREALESIKHIPSDPYPFNGADNMDQIERMMKTWGDGVMESFEAAITLCDGDLCDVKRKELCCEIDEHMHHISIAFRVQHCNRIMDLALNQLRHNVQTHLASHELLSAPRMLIQQLKDGALAVYERGASPNGGESLFTIGEAYSNTRDELIRQIHDILYLLFEKQLGLYSNSVMNNASEEMSNMSFFGATAGNTGEDIREKAATSFESTVKSWIPEDCNWDTNGEYYRVRSELEEMRKAKRNRIIKDTAIKAGRTVAAAAALAIVSVAGLA